MKIFKNSYVLGLVLVIVELTINHILFAAKLPNTSGVIVAIFAGAIYSAYHKQKMPFKERIKTLAVYIILVGIIGIFTGIGSASVLAPWISIAILLGILLVYGVGMYFMLGVGSSGYMAAYERKQAAQQVGVSEQNPLQPIPDAVTFKNRHPKIALTLSSIICTLMFIGMAFIAVDPLYQNNVRIYTAILGIVMGVIIVGALSVALGKRISIAVISTIVLVLIVFGAHLAIASQPPAAGVDTIMIANEEVALRCMKKNNNLLGDSSGWNKGVPQVESPVCYHESNWKTLPRGWMYTKIVDANVGDGTFAFGVHSRADDYIFCGEKWCVMRDAQKTTTIISTVPTPVSASITLPKSTTAHAGEQVQIAQLALTNTTDSPVDLTALWYKKSGTASDAVIDMVYLIDDKNNYGTNYIHDLKSPYTSKDGMVYINQPDMFVVQPGQTHTYNIQIKLSNKAAAEIGKTIGLDFVGFASSTAITGMPAAGALYTIQ